MSKSINPDSRLLPVGVSQADVLAMLKWFRSAKLPIDRAVLPPHAGGTGSPTYTLPDQVAEIADHISGPLQYDAGKWTTE